MFCPKCRCGYERGITRCADCRVPLVKKLPPKPKLEYTDLVEVLTTNDMGQIAFVKSLLKAHNIHFYSQGDKFVALRRAPNMPVRFLVKKSEARKAFKLLDEGKLIYTGDPKQEYPKKKKVAKKSIKKKRCHRCKGFYNEGDCYCRCGEVFKWF
ncbi:hypothetical protein BVX98_00415 [bacterium F11]|nr:hypothetical protein BVX98_00415 [bacterium F11]